MTLIKSISGIRGTIGGKPGSSLTPLDIVRFTAAFAQWVLTQTKNNKIVIGRDARISGEMIRSIVSGTLTATGMQVIDIGLAPTPTVAIAVPREQAGGGIIITASHNPKQWNALKLLNAQGEYISAEDGQAVFKLAERELFDFVDIKQLGCCSFKDNYIAWHIEQILNLPLVDRQAITNKKLKVVVDAVNSVGGISVPPLLKALGVKDIVELFCEPNGNFPHNPEPLPEHLSELATEVKQHKADLGIAVDPDADRLAFVCEDGSMFGEEYTLVAIADYILQHKKGNVVSNLSSTRALRDISEKHGGKYYASAVGEVHVVQKMKAVKAVIGGEGNGGVIYPPLHYGRDALVGIALFLSYLAKSGKRASVLRRMYPDYYMTKRKIQLDAGIDIDKLLQHIQKRYKKNKVNTEDGVKIEFDPETIGWVHLRPSNTEPVIRIYAEGQTQTISHNLAKKLIQDISEWVKSEE